MNSSTATSKQHQPYSHTEIAMHVRGMVAEGLRVPVSQAPEAAHLRALGLDACAVLDVVSELEKTLGADLLEARALAFRDDATVGQLIDLIEGSVSGGTR